MTKRVPKKKPTKKRTAKKKAPLKTTTLHKRKTNAKAIQFTKGKHDPEKIIDTLERFEWSKFDYLRRRNKPDGHHYKPPQGFTVIITVKKGKNTYHYTKLTPADFVVNKKSVAEFTKEATAELLEKFNTARDAMESDDNEPDDDEKPEDYIDNLDPSFIQSVTIRFLYGK